jgi:membrane-bound metal-dependent hydrolase YbcI (DUF457 family)
MFIGHYGVALAAKPIRKSIPLWLLFIAVQWLDVVWSVLVLLGVEKVRIVQGFTEASPLDLYYMPYTHGLLGALALSLVLGAIASLFIRDRRGAVIAVVGGAVFSHWLLDLVVHVNDLPLLGDSMKVGFGLWRHVWISFPLEIATLLIGAAAYAVYDPAPTRTGRRRYWGFVVLMALTEFYAAFGPTPATPAAAAETALFGYFALAGLAAIADRLRNVPEREQHPAVADPSRLANRPISG